MINASPHFDPLGLQLNGGLTVNFALMALSSAIDQGTAAGAITDQRGYVRSIDIFALPNAATPMAALDSQRPLIKKDRPGTC